MKYYNFKSVQSNTRSKANETKYTYIIIKRNRYGNETSNQN